ncbi:MAG: hypothetical protein QY325_00970 [Flavobacteriales bacterium]|nr:MAG: hypothetical protein QY325_00970 [Flavobacteriales bacterium]
MSEKQIKVVSIITPTRVVINWGSQEGAKIGMAVLIYGLSTDEVFDPDTKTSLGHIELLRGRGKIIHAQEQMATVESIQKEPSTRVITRKQMFGLGEEREERSDIKDFDDVQVGDLVRLIR